MLFRKHSSLFMLASAVKKITPLAGILLLGACASYGQSHAMAQGETLSPKTNKPAPKQASGNALFELGKNFAARGEHNAAIPLFRTAYSKTGAKAAPLLYLGKSLMAVGQYDEALETLNAANKKRPHDQNILLSLGQLHLIIYDPQTAKGYFLKAIQAKESKHNNNGTAKAHSGLGISLELLGDHQGAQSAFNSGLNKNPDDLELLSNKALSLAINGQTEEAIEILLDIAVHPQAQSRHRQNLALAYAFHGDSVRSWQVASIDMPANMAERTVAGFYTVKAMEKENRMKTLVYGMTAPRTDLEQVANKVSLEVDGSDASKRIGKTEPIALVEKKDHAPTMPPLMDPKGWAVQIGAYRKPAEIIAGWEILRERYFDIIGHLEPRRSEVSFGDRTGDGPSGFYYRLNAGPLSGYRQSRDICTALITAGGDCWIRPPEPSEGRLPDAKD